MTGEATARGFGENDSYVLTYRDQTTSVFDSTGRLLRLVDRNGYATTLAYLPSGRIETVTDEAGRALVYGYDGAGRITEISDPLGREVAYGYDAAGDLVSVTDPAGYVTRYGYDDEHRIVSMIDPRGHETRNSYDASDRVVEQIDPAGGVMRFGYTDTSTTVTDPRGHVTRYEHTDGLTTRVVRAVGTPLESAVSVVRDASGNVTRRTDAGGHVTTLAYNPDGLPTRMTDPLGRVTTLTYNATGDPLTIGDAVATTTMTYDAHGNPTSVQRPLTGSSSVARTTSAYDPAHPGDLISTTDPDGHVWHYAYDTAGNLVEQTDPVGNRTTIDYNAIGWVTSTVGARGNAPGGSPAQFQTRLTYDELGNVVAVQDPLGHTTRTSYNADGNPITMTDADGATTRTTYDELDRAIRVTRPDDSVLRLDYDAAGNRTTVTDALDHATTFSYDALDRVTSHVDALNRTTSYAYDTAGRQTSTTDAAGRTTSFAYDAASQLTSVAYSDGQTHGVSYDYDELGRRVRMTDGSGTSTRSWDSLGRLVSATDASNRALSYEYDLAGRLTKITYPRSLVAQTSPGQTVADPSVTRRYDDAGRVTAIEDWLGSSTAYTYDPAGNLVEQRYPNDATATLSYDRAGALTRRSDQSPAGPILELAYTRTSTGRVHTAGETGNATSTLGYDQRSQLESATTSGQPTTGYAYDLADRLTRVTDPSSATRLEYDAANQLQRAVDAATGDPQATFAYDAVGNRTQAQPATSDPLTAPVATTYDYDQAGRLTTVTKPATSPTQPGIDAAYAYDGDGLRSDLLWDRTAGPPEILADEHGLYITGPDGLPLEQLRYDGTRRFYHHDQLGSTRALTNTTGAVVATSDYTPYGQPTTPSDATNPFGYAGQYTDHQTGLIYLRARWYDPATGQFLTPDPIGHTSGETNLYRYAAGDPANGTDPSGLFSIGGFIASLDNPVSQAVAGALNGAFVGAPANIFGFDPACAGDTFDFGSTYLSLAVPFPGGKLEAAGKLAAKGESRLGALLRRVHTDETGSFDPAEFVKVVMGRKKGSIQRAPLPPGSPSWDEVREMTMGEIEAAAKANEPGFKTILKLLQDKRFDR